MSALASPHAAAQHDVGARLAFQKQLQAVTNKIHATSNIDEIMLEVSADLCALFNADRLTIYSVAEDKQSIISKVKTGLNSFKDLKLPIAEHSIAGYVALAKKTVNIRDVYDDAELRSLNANLRFLQEVDKRTGYRTKQMLVAPIVEAGSAELIGVIQIINNKGGTPFSALAEEGVAELSQTLAIAFKQRQKPHAVKSKYDYLIAEGVLSAGRVRARLAPGAQEIGGRGAGAGGGVPGQAAGDRLGAVEILRRAVRALQARPREADGAAEEPEARVRGGQPLAADRRVEGGAHGALPGPRAHPLLAHRGQRLPQGAPAVQGHDAEGFQRNRPAVLRRRGGRSGQHRRSPLGPLRRRRWKPPTAARTRRPPRPTTSSSSS